MSQHHRIISHKDTKEFSKMVGKLTLKQKILFNISILTIGITVSIAMINPIPVIIAGLVALKLSHNKRKPRKLIILGDEKIEIKISK